MSIAIVFFGAALNLVGSFSYIRDTLRGETKPNRVTWFLWSVVPLIAVVASLSDGVTWAVLPVFMSGFCPFLIFVASFLNKNAYWKLGTFDYTCGVFSILALIMWAITGDAVIAIVFAIIADFAAGLPTLIKAWRFPETETATAYVLAVFSFITSFIVLESWDFTGYAFPLYLMLMNGAIAVGILRYRLARQ